MIRPGSPERTPKDPRGRPLMTNNARTERMAAAPTYRDAWKKVQRGLIPAFPLLVIRPFLPESPAWQQKPSAGTLRRPSLAELFTPQLRRAALVTTALFAMSYGAAFGASQHTPRPISKCSGLL